MKKILLLITVLFAAVFTMPAWAQNVYPTRLLAQQACLDYVSAYTGGSTSGCNNVQTSPDPSPDGSGYFRTGCSSHTYSNGHTEKTCTPTGPNQVQFFYPSAPCEPRQGQSAGTQTFPELQAPTFACIDYCQAELDYLVPQGNGTELATYVYNGNQCAGDGSGDGQSSSQSSSSGSGSSDSGDGGEGEGGSSSSDGGENGGGSSSDGNSSSSGNSSSAGSGCGFDSNCDGTIDGDDYDYIDEDDCYVGHDTTRYCQDTDIGTGPDGLPNNCFEINGQIFCPDIDGDGEGDGEGDGGESEGDGSSSSAGASSSTSNSSSEPSCDPEAETCENSVSGGADCEDPPVCESNNPMYCELIMQQYRLRCPATDLDELDTETPYDSESSHTVDIDGRVEQAKEDYITKFESILGEIQSTIDINVPSSGGDLECQSVELFGANVDLGLCNISEFFNLIGYAVIAAAALISFSILFTRPS